MPPRASAPTILVAGATKTAAAWAPVEPDDGLPELPQKKLWCGDQHTPTSPFYGMEQGVATESGYPGYVWMPMP
jgi:hypothetical protein